MYSFAVNKFILILVTSTICACSSLSDNVTEVFKVPTNESVTQFGQPLGVNNSVIGYSNCSNNYISNEANYLGTAYSGMKWQCVEYSRRWLEHVKGVKFGDVDAAFQIWDISSVNSLTESNVSYPFESYINGGKFAPQAGDLIIYKYALPDFPYGHVGVIVDVNIMRGYVDIAEQNYSNEIWENPKSYARRLILRHDNLHYTIVDHDFDPKLTQSVGGAIIGWKRVRM